MNLELQGKEAVVCGSTQGIGLASAIELARLGATVTLLARNESKLKKVHSELPRGFGQDHAFLVADFSNVSEVEAAIGKHVRDRITHILVNNTGGPPGGQAIDAEPQAFIKAFSSHLLCNQVLVQSVVPGMKKEGYGRIINIISTSVKIPIRGLGVSNTIRGAVASWAKTLSVELAPFGITVNNVLPGSTDTQRLDEIIRSKAEKAGVSVQQVRKEMVEEIPAGRIGLASEVAAAVAFLATPAASYINGVSLPVDGGRTGSL
jgi:3-oxoacyl-[acyl-carrier protein] reductase